MKTRLKWIGLVVSLVAMLVGIVCSVLLIGGKPLGDWDIPVRIGACVGIAGMVAAVAIAESRA